MPDTGQTMASNFQKAPLRNGLRDVLMDDFWKDPLIVVDTLHQKLNGLPIDKKKNPTLAQEMRTALELLRAVGTRRYGKISFLAILDLLQAAHYFLLLSDRTPDSEEDGYKDDAEVLHQAFSKHVEEIREFEAWFRGQRL